MKTPESTLFHLLSCVAKGTAPEASLFANMGAGEWDALYKLAKDQGVTALVFDKLESLPAEVAPPKQLMLQWFSHTLSIAKQMERKYIVAADFAERLAAANIPVVVLKGFAIAAYYPQPLHRECGDLDCYMLGKMAEGEAVAASFGAVVEEANYKHSHIKYKGLTIENHKYFTSFNNTARGKGTEAALKQLIFAKAPARWDNSALLRPNATFNAF
ncbi:MAG: nucleotidyltransferase family protein, partial [Candidatus Egerieousia sp.]